MEIYDVSEFTVEGVSSEIEESMKENIEHNKMIVKMFLKKIGTDVDYSDVIIYITKAAIQMYNICFVLHAELDIKFIYIFAKQTEARYENLYTLTLIEGIIYNEISTMKNIHGDITFLDDKPKSKYIFDYVMDGGDKKMRPIFRDLYNLLFLTDYMQNLPKAYTFLLCCPGTIPKGVDKIIAKKILFFVVPNKIEKEKRN